MEIDYITEAEAERMLAEALLLQRQARQWDHSPLAEQGEHELEAALRRLRDELRRLYGGIPFGMGSTEAEWRRDTEGWR
jgi:hypothetical protein